MDIFYSKTAQEVVCGNQVAQFEAGVARAVPANVARKLDHSTALLTIRRAMPLKDFGDIAGDLEAMPEIKTVKFKPETGRDIPVVVMTETAKRSIKVLRSAHAARKKAVKS